MQESSALLDRTNAALKSFNSHSWKLNELQQAVQLLPTPSNSQHTENYTRYTSQDPTSMTGLTGMTGMSDSGVLVVDPDDRDKVAQDIAAFKDHVSTLKFAYLESNIKLQFVSHIMNPDGLKLVATDENEALEKERLRTKAELKQRKARAAELERLIRAEAEVLQARHQATTEEANTAEKLLRECAALEVEIAMLKNKRTPIQRITIAEAQSLCDDQESKLATYGPEIKACERKMKETTHTIRTHKAALEKLSVKKRELKKEMEDREAKGKRDERAEQGCRWITDATALYSSLLGIRSAYAVGTPPTEMVIQYESAKGHDGDFRTLSISLGKDGSMTGAHLVDSSEDIQDIVEVHLSNQDMRSLVQEVRARIGR